MPDTVAVDVDQAKPLQISVLGQSPHTFAYRFWQQAPGATAWTKIAEGHTADTAPDTFTVEPLPAGSTISYWIAVAGKPNTSWRAMVELAQEGVPVPGGAVPHSGTTSESGGAVVQHQVALA